MYVPQGSNFYLDFLPIDKTKLAKVDINIQVAIISGSDAATYDIYDEQYAGYGQTITYANVIEKYMNLISYTQIPE